MANERIKKRRSAGGYGRECIGGRIGRRRPARRAWFAGDKEIFTRPRDDGDCRYPYGSDGFNFWAYTSGYMHSNEGIFSPFLRSAEGQEPKLCWFAGFPTEAGSKIVPLLAVPETEDDAVRYTVFNKSFVTYMCEAEGAALERARVCDR